MAVWSLWQPERALSAWLVAYAFWSAIVIGAIVLLLVHALTGGRWGEAVAPVLKPTAALMPVLALLFIPLALGLTWLYPWARDPGSVHPSVVALYLNRPFWLARSVMALAAWTGLTPELGLLASLLGAAVGYLALLAVAWAYRRLRSRDGLGLGDAKLLAAAGAWLGPAPLPWVILLAAPMGLVLALARRAPLRGDSAVPFGPPLALACWLLFLWRASA